MSLFQILSRALESGRARTPDLIRGDMLDADGSGADPIPAAVLVPVVDRSEPSVILTLRPETMRKHAGQVSFPGGRIDPEDAGPIQAALREAEEEIALPRSAVQVVGLADRYLTVTGFDVTPVIGVVSPDVQLVPQPSEVADVFEAPLAHLLDPANHSVRSAQWQGMTRTYYEIAYRDRRVWGATAAMIVNLSRRLELAL
jgi:8-oxo-dGTP pyrophosphatase MutT (NUDIX family)